MAKLIWGEGGEAVVDSGKDLETLLDRLTKESASGDPIVVELVHDNGASLSIGIGRQLSVVNHVPASLDPPYHRSVGDSSNQEPQVFYYRGDWSEFPARSAVPISQARAALQQFLDSGALPDNIAWEEI